MNTFIYIVGTVNIIAALGILYGFYKHKHSIRDNNGDTLEDND